MAYYHFMDFLKRFLKLYFLLHQYLGIGKCSEMVDKKISNKVLKNPKFGRFQILRGAEEAAQGYLVSFMLGHWVSDGVRLLIELKLSYLNYLPQNIRKILQENCFSGSHDEAYKDKRYQNFQLSFILTSLSSSSGRESNLSFLSYGQTFHYI